MKRNILIALVAIVVSVMAGGNIFAADDTYKKVLRKGNGESDLHSGKVVKVAELAAESADETTAGSNGEAVVKISDLPNGVKVGSKDEKGEWIRLGENFGGANTISEIVVKVCSKPYISAVMEYNEVTSEEAKRLPKGFGVYIPHKYLKPEYRFSMEKLIVAYDELDQLKQQLKDKGLDGNAESDRAAVAELEKLQQQFELATAEIKRLNDELCLRDEKIAALEQENAILKGELVRLKAELVAKETEVLVLKDDLAAEKKKRQDAIAEVRVALKAFLQRLDELEQQ